MESVQVLADSQLRDLACGTLRRAASAARVQDAVDEDARALMRRTCMTAQARGIRAEQLLLLLKQAWQELPEAQRIPRYDAGQVLARIITVCIHEYYAEPRRSIDRTGWVSADGPLPGPTAREVPTGGLQSRA